MVISEFLPNPVGSDTQGEYIELFNNSSQAQNLNGWKIKDASGKTYAFKNKTAAPGEYIALDYKTSKITLNNNGETLFLYDASGNLVDEAGYRGKSPEGQAAIRQGNNFVFTARPTPGARNILEAKTSPLASSPNTIQTAASDLDSFLGSDQNILGQFDSSAIFIGISIALILSAFFIFIYKKLDFGNDY